MKIVDYLRRDQMSLDLKEHSKEEAIKEMSILVKGAKEICDFEAFVCDVLEREKMATTGIGHEVAIPHARTEVVEDFVIAFGRSRQGVEFGSLDGKPVKLIFLMGTPKEKGISTYLKILAYLSRLLEKKSFRNSLLKATSAKEIIGLFNQVEN